MPRKKRPRRRAPRSAIAPWVILGVSLAVIGFACTRMPQAAHTAAPEHLAGHAAPTTRAAASAAPQTRAPAAGGQAATSGGESQSGPTVQPTPISGVAPTSEPVKPVPANAPRLALIIDDCGQWLDTERGFIALPVALTMSVLPDVRYNQTIEHEAANENKGVMLHLPMETLSGVKPGPGEITTEMNDDAIAAQVEHDLGDVDLARGVNNHEGSKATADPRVMNDVMAVLARQNRFFIDSRTNRSSVAQEIASEHGVATARRNVFIDNEASVSYTEAQLRLAATLAKRDGSAIAIGHPKPSTLAAVRAMIPELEADGIVFVKAGELAH